MEINKMKTKQELKEAMEYIGYSPERFEEAWKNKIELAKTEKGASSDEEAEKKAIHILKRQLTKLVATGGGFERKTLVFIGADRVTDFGASKKYDEIKKEVTADFHTAFFANKCTREGHPVWGMDAPAFKRGQIIDVEAEQRRVWYCAIIENKVFTLACVELSGKDAKTPLPPQGQVLEMDLKLKTGTAHDYGGKMKFFASKHVRNMTFNGKYTDEQLMDIVKTIGEPFWVDYNNLESIAEANPGYNDIYFFEQDVLTVDTSLSKNFAIVVLMPGENWKYASTGIKAFYQYDLPTNIKDDAICFFIGKPRIIDRKTQEGAKYKDLTLDLYSIVTPYKSDESEKESIGNKGNEVIGNQMEIEEESMGNAQPTSEAPSPSSAPQQPQPTPQPTPQPQPQPAPQGTTESVAEQPAPPPVPNVPTPQPQPAPVAQGGPMPAPQASQQEQPQPQPAPAPQPQPQPQPEGGEKRQSEKLKSW